MKLRPSLSRNFEPYFSIFVDLFINLCMNIVNTLYFYSVGHFSQKLNLFEGIQYITWT